VKVGDIVIFLADKIVDHDQAGLIVADSTSLTTKALDPDDDPGVLIKFFGESREEPLHYYERELEQWINKETVKIKYAT